LEKDWFLLPFLRPFPQGIQENNFLRGVLPCVRNLPPLLIAPPSLLFLPPSHSPLVYSHTEWTPSFPTRCSAPPPPFTLVRCFFPFPQPLAMEGVFSLALSSVESLPFSSFSSSPPGVCGADGSKLRPLFPLSNLCSISSRLPNESFPLEKRVLS